MNYITDKKLTLENMKDMSIDKIVELYRSGHRIDTSGQKYMRYINIKNLQTLDPTCLSYIYDRIRNKKIDTSHIPLLENSPIVPGDTVRWFIVTGFGAPMLEFLDNRNTINDYMIIIFLHGYSDISSTCCTNNPVTECTCVGSDNAQLQCISGNTADKQGNLISNSIPQNIMDIALDSLPIVPEGSGGAMIFGLVGVTLAMMMSSKTNIPK